MNEKSLEKMNRALKNTLSVQAKKRLVHSETESEVEGSINLPKTKKNRAAVESSSSSDEVDKIISNDDKDDDDAMSEDESLGSKPVNQKRELWIDIGKNATDNFFS